MAATQGVFEPTQSKYLRKRNPSTDQGSIEENEVRITTQGRVKRYADYAVRLLNGPQEKEKEAENAYDGKTPNDNENTDRTGPTKQFDTIVLKATGRAIYSAVTTAEVVKRKVANLYQMTKLDTLEMTDIWEPQEEGLKEVKTTRRVASICIILSRNQSELEVNAVGYQEPIPAESVGGPGISKGNHRGRNRNRGGGRGGGLGMGAGFRGNAPAESRNFGRAPGYRGGRRHEFGNNNQERDFQSNRRFGGGYNRGSGRDQGGASRPRGNNQNFGNNRQQNRR